MLQDAARDAVIVKFIALYQDIPADKKSFRLIVARIYEQAVGAIVDNAVF